MKIDTQKFKVLKFSYFSSEDPSDMRFGHEICWSRIYEYPLVLAELQAINKTNIAVHNCSWGFQDIHLVFKTWLDINHPGTIHSDIKYSSLFNTVCWDITTPPTEAWEGRFDAVINVSTLEEVAADHVEVLKNHLMQLKKGGRFIGTFDVPGLQVNSVENFLNERIVHPPKKLNPRNSRLEDKKLGLPENFNVVYLVIERVF